MRWTMLGLCLLLCPLSSCDDGGSSCEKTVEVTLTFWDNTCWGGGIRCDGEWVAERHSHLRTDDNYTYPSSGA